ncbi:MAG TPA: ATP-binding protein [Candidatus Competibacteraceae bacterium]|nr:ATP-binding protein [Candidatus Competibacteraceae bacterium]
MNDIYVGKGERDVYLLGKYANRHGLIAGATGTGKSVSLMVLAEGFSRLGVPVFLADVKGDLAGLSQPGQPSDKLQARLQQLGIRDWAGQANPVVFWDVYGQNGHPVRTTISEMGAPLLARVLELNDTQEGVLSVAFTVADDNGLLLLDIDDLRSMLAFVAENAKEISGKYGLVSTQSIGAIQRALLQLEKDGGDQFFGEPALDLADFMRRDMTGRGVINVLAAESLIHKPRLYATFLLWMLSELFENLPEVGDVELPNLVFFFDEAHLLFADVPDSLRQRIEQVVRLIRSKGVGVYFISQLPDDVPDQILGQLGNRIQHALRAFTPRDQKAVRIAAETFPPNPKLNVVEVITQLGVGEALVTTLQEGGVPLPVERTLIAPPRCRIGAISAQERANVRQLSPIGGKYDTPVNRESAHERLQQRAQAMAMAEPTRGKAQAAQPQDEGIGGLVKDWLLGNNRRQGAIEAMAKSTMRTVGNQLGKQILRGVLGSIMRR